MCFQRKWTGDRNRTTFQFALSDWSLKHRKSYSFSNFKRATCLSATIEQQTLGWKLTEIRLYSIAEVLKKELETQRDILFLIF